MSTPPTNTKQGGHAALTHVRVFVHVCGCACMRMCAVRLLEVGWREPPVETETRVPAPGQLTYKKLKDN